MKVKPKETLLNLPIVLLFDQEERIPEFAANINQLVHGKVKVKYEELGTLGSQFVGLFYFQRNDEFSQLRQEFVEMIEQEQMRQYADRQNDERRLTDEEHQDQHWKSLADLGKNIK